MKLTTVMALSVLGSLATSVSVYALTPTGIGLVAASNVSASAVVPDAAVEVASRFAVDATVKVEARVGHAHVVAGGDRETYVVVEARGSEPSAAARAPLGLALVIDRSGSMEGTRIVQALRAARGVVDRLADGDHLTVVTFDDTARVVVPTTEISEGSRARIGEAISRIGLGDATCMSCGIEMAMTELNKQPDRVRQMIVLSDGKANMGIQKADGFVSMATAAGERGVAISTVGVGLAYDERYLARISAGSNGQHHFVENDAGLPALFEAAAQQFAATVASDVEAEIALGEGVEVLEVMDRAFTRRGGSVVVSLGALSRGETKTVLMKVRLPESQAAAATVAEVELRYADHVLKGEGRANGMLQVSMVGAGTAAASLDPFVAERIERSRTGALLEEANELIRDGKAEEAQKRLTRRSAELDAFKHALPEAAAGDSRGADIDRQLEEQRRRTSRAVSDLKPRPKSPGGAPQPSPVAPSVKQNQVDAFDSFR